MSMIIKRFKAFPKKNEDTILVECGFPEAVYSYNDLRFYIASEKFVFLFVEEQDIEWIKKPDAFSVKIENSMNKTLLIPEIEGKSFVVFIEEKGMQHYVFYGRYRLDNLYTIASGAGEVIDGYSPLVFCLDNEEYEIM